MISLPVKLGRYSVCKNSTTPTKTQHVVQGTNNIRQMKSVKVKSIRVRRASCFFFHFYAKLTTWLQEFLRRIHLLIKLLARKLILKYNK